MNTTDYNQPINLNRNMCIALVWLISYYSSIIQYKYIKIPNGMLLIGAAILVSYILSFSGGRTAIRDLLTDESILMLFFMAYMLIVGLVVAPDRSSHISQWIRCMEYLFIQIVIASLIKDSGTESFIALLLSVAIVLAVIFIRKPVEFGGSGRYSISSEVNPNGLGMLFTSGIWAVLYVQQKKKLPLIAVAAIGGLFGYCIILTGSRKALIAAGIIILLWFFVCLLPSLKYRGILSGILAFFIMLLLTIITGRILLSIYADSSMNARMNEILYASSAGSRGALYRSGFGLFKESPLFGFGFQGFSYYFGAYSHATLVEVPVSGGIIGALLYFSIYFISLKKTVTLFLQTKGIPELVNEHMRVKMDLILWVAMLFYSTCIIHPYQFDSFILFGMIFGDTAYTESKLTSKPDTVEIGRIGSRYIKE